MSCVCKPHHVDGMIYSQFWGTYFGECVYTPRQQLSMILGLTSIALYGIALAPQIMKTYRRKSIEGLSIGLLVFWTLGDICNTMGAILTKQFMLQIWTGIYFLIADAAIICQYLYYKLSKTYRAPISTPIDDETASLLSNTSSEVPNIEHHASRRFSAAIIGLGVTFVSNYRAKATSGDTIVGHVLQASAYTDILCNASAVLSVETIALGKVFAWFSGIFYLFSRLPQIYTNFLSKSVQGISPSLFVTTLMANMLYGGSILLRKDEISNKKSYSSTLPYLIGSIGTLASDFYVLSQVYLYSDKRQQR